MPYRVKQCLILLAVFSSVFTPAKVQIAMPMYVPGAMPQPMYAVPAPMPIAVAIQLPDRKVTSTTTTTTTAPPESQYAIAVPVPVPMPMSVQFAMPAQPPPVFCQGKTPQKSCPTCPPCVCQPSCTPAFFSYCSPCHQKCRCRNPAEAPVPLPSNSPMPVPRPIYPVPMVPAPLAPAPVVVVPIPPIIRRRDFTSSSDSDTSDSCDDSNRRYHKRRGKKSRKAIFKVHRRKFRRDAGDESEQNSDLVKPVLSYISKNGDVKFESELSNRDAMKLLSEGKLKSSDEKPMYMENDGESVAVTRGRWKSGRKYKKVLLRGSTTNLDLKRGKNEFVFKPSSNKNINSVAVSFQVT